MRQPAWEQPEDMDPNYYSEDEEEIDYDFLWELKHDR